MKFITGISALIFFIAMVPTIAPAQDKSSEVDKILSWASSETPGCIVAISQNGKMVYKKAVGMANLEKQVPMDLNATFDIGSARKQFVAAAILLLAEDKKLTLSDDVRKFFPSLPVYGRKITVDNLLTHTSGIRDWTGLQPLATDNPDAMQLIMRQQGLNFRPGEQWGYSNSGYVLLAEMVSKISGMSFANFLSKRIFLPLGMKSSSYVMDLRGEVVNRAMAYKKEKGVFIKDMLLDNDRGGAGALFSTAGDLIIWNDALNNKRLGKLVSAKLHEATKLNNGRILNYGRGLVLEGNIFWHSGGAAGYHSWIGSVPELGLSIAVLCNSDQVAASALADKILAIYAPEAGLQKAEDGPPPTLVGATLVNAKRFSGLFINDSGETLRLAVDRDRFRVAGGPGLVALTNNEFRRWGSSVFFMSQDEFVLKFITDDEVQLKTMEGKIELYKRAVAYNPTAMDLAEFTGRFFSPEILATFDFSAGDGVLIGKANQGNPITIKPIYKDTFQIAGVIFKFLRNKSGKVASMSYSNPVVQDINFFYNQ